MYVYVSERGLKCHCGLFISVMVGGGTDYFKFKLFFNITVIINNVKFYICINKFLKITSFLNII